MDFDFYKASDDFTKDLLEDADSNLNKIRDGLYKLPGFIYYLQASIPEKHFKAVLTKDQNRRLAGRNLHPVRNLQKDAVRLIPALTDAGDQPGIFQFPQSGLDCPLAPIKIIRHLLDRIDYIDISILRLPTVFLGKYGAVQKQPV